MIDEMSDDKAAGVCGSFAYEFNPHFFSEIVRLRSR